MSKKSTCRAVCYKKQQYCIGDSIEFENDDEKLWKTSVCIMLIVYYKHI